MTYFGSLGEGKLMQRLRIDESEYKAHAAFLNNQQQRRDQLAAEFMKPLINDGDTAEQRIANAHLAYTYADAMLSASGEKWDNSAYQLMRDKLSAAST